MNQKHHNTTSSPPPPPERRPKSRLTLKSIEAFPVNESTLPKHTLERPSTVDAARARPRCKPSLFGHLPSDDVLPPLTNQARAIHSLANNYFESQEQYRHEKREVFARQRRAMLLDSHEASTRSTSPRRGTATLINVGEQTAGEVMPYLVLNPNQQRIVLQTRYRAPEKVPEADEEGRSFQIHIPVTSDVPPTDPFTALAPMPLDGAKANVPPIFQHAKQEDIVRVHEEVKGFFDELPSSRMPSTGFLHPEKLRFIGKRADELLREEQCAQQHRQREELIAAEERARLAFAPQAERERMDVIARWLSSFPLGHQLEMLALQQKYFPPALARHNNEGEIARKGPHGRKAVFLHVPEGAGNSGAGPVRGKRLKNQGSKDTRITGASPDIQANGRKGTNTAHQRRRSSATRADIDKFFASLVDEDDENQRQKSKKTRAKKRKESASEVSPAVPELEGGDCVERPEKVSEVRCVPADPFEQMKEALERVGVVYDSFTASNLYKAEGAASASSRSPFLPALDTNHDAQHLVRFNALGNGGSTRAQSINSTPSVPAEALSDEEVKSSGSRQSSPSLRSNSDFTGRTRHDGTESNDLDTRDEDPSDAGEEGNSVSDDSRSRSHSRAASIASAFGAVAKPDEESPQIQPRDANVSNQVQDAETVLQVPSHHTAKVGAGDVSILRKPERVTKVAPAAPNSMHTRRQPSQSLAAANAAAKRFRESTRASIGRMIEDELQCRLMCNWFGGPSRQLAEAFEVTVADEVLLLQNSTPEMSASFADTGIQKAPALLNHRLLSRLNSKDVPCDKRVHAAIVPSSAEASEGAVGIPSSLSDVVSAACEAFECVYEATMPVLIGKQLSYSTETCASMLDVSDELVASRSIRPSSASSALESSRSGEMRDALARAIDAFRATDHIAAQALLYSKSSGLRKAQIAAQTSSGAANQAASVVNRMLEAVLPSFLRPVQEDRHMLLVADSRSSRSKSKHHKGSGLLRANPSITRSDLFLANAVESFTELQKLLLSSDAQRTQMLINGGERAGLASRVPNTGNTVPASKRRFLEALQAHASNFSSDLPFFVTKVLDLSMFAFVATSEADFSSLPFILPGVPLGSWEDVVLLLYNFLDRADVVASNLIVLNAHDAVSVEVNWLEIDDAFRKLFDSMPLRLFASLREEHECRQTLRWLVQLCGNVTIRRYTASLALQKRGQVASTTLPSVAHGMWAYTGLNSRLVDSMLTVTAADLLYSTLAKAHTFTAPFGDFDVSKFPLVLTPSEIVKSSFVHFIQLFNAYSPLSNGWIRSESYSTDEQRVLRLLLAKAHASLLLGIEGDAPESGLVPFPISALSTVSSSIVSALFAADEAAIELDSLRRKIEDLLEKRHNCKERSDRLGDELRSLNYQILISNQNMPSSSLAAAAARRMSVVSATPFEGRNSYSGMQTAHFERQLEIETERQKVLEEVTLVELQLRNLGEERERVLNVLCKAQSVALVGSCIDAAATLMFSSSPNSVSFSDIDPTSFLVEEKHSSRRAQTVKSILEQSSARKSTFQSAAAVKPDSDLRKLPHLLQLTSSMAQTAASKSEPSSETMTFSLSPRTWRLQQFLMPFCRRYCVGEANSHRLKRSEIRHDTKASEAKSKNSLANWLFLVELENAGLNDFETSPLIVDGLVSGAVAAAIQSHRVVHGLAVDSSHEAEIIKLHSSPLPMVPLLPNSMPRDCVVQRGVRLNFLFAWRVSGIVLRFVACKLFPVLDRVRERRAKLDLWPRAAFVVQCAYRRLLQRRRIRARAAVRRIERFLYGKIQEILARKTRAYNILRRAMRLWHMKKVSASRVEASLILMRDEVLRRRMQCMHAQRILKQLKRLQEERTVLVDKCALTVHRILSDERLEWRILCERVRSQFFAELADLLANEAERECLRTMVSPDSELLENGDENCPEFVEGARAESVSSPVRSRAHERRDSDSAFAFFKAFGKRLSVGAALDVPPSPAYGRRKNTEEVRRASQTEINTLVDALNPTHRRSIIDMLASSMTSAVADRRSSVAVAESSISAWRKSNAGSLFAADAHRRASATTEGGALHVSNSKIVDRCDDERNPDSLLSAAALRLLKGHSRLPRFSVIGAANGQLEQPKSPAVKLPLPPMRVVAGPIVLHHYKPQTLHEHTDTAEYVRELFFTSPIDVSSLRKPSMGTGKAPTPRAVEVEGGGSTIQQKSQNAQNSSIQTSTKSTPIWIPMGRKSLSFDSFSATRNAIYPSQQPFSSFADDDICNAMRDIVGENRPTATPPLIEVSPIPPQYSRSRAVIESGTRVVHKKDANVQQRRSRTGSEISTRKVHKWCPAEDYDALRRTPLAGWISGAGAHSIPTTTIGRYWLRLSLSHDDPLKCALYQRIICFVKEQHPQLFFPLWAPSLPTNPSEHCLASSIGNAPPQVDEVARKRISTAARFSKRDLRLSHFPHALPYRTSWPLTLQSDYDISLNADFPAGHRPPPMPMDILRVASTELLSSRERSFSSDSAQCIATLFLFCAIESLKNSSTTVYQKDDFLFDRALFGEVEEPAPLISPNVRQWASSLSFASKTFLKYFIAQHLADSASLLHVVAPEVSYRVSRISESLAPNVDDTRVPVYDAYPNSESDEDDLKGTDAEGTTSISRMLSDQQPPNSIRLRNCTALQKGASFDYIPLSAKRAHATDVRALRPGRSMRRIGSRRFNEAEQGTRDVPLLPSAVQTSTVQQVDEPEADSELAHAFTDLLTTTERIHRKALEQQLSAVLTGIYEHVRWHMLVLFITENTLSSAASEAPRGGVKKTHLSRFNTLVPETNSGIHPVFVEGGLLPALSPMWVLQKGIALLQEEYAQRSSIICEYAETPLMHLHSILSSEKGDVNSSSPRHHLEPRKPALPPQGVFRGRATSVACDAEGRRKLSTLTSDDAHSSHSNCLQAPPGHNQPQDLGATVSSASSSAARYSTAMPADPFASFAPNGGNEAFEAAIPSTTRRQSTLKEKNDEYQRRLSLMAEGHTDLPENRRGTLQFFESEGVQMSRMNSNEIGVKEDASFDSRPSLFGLRSFGGNRSSLISPQDHRDSSLSLLSPSGLFQQPLALPARNRLLSPSVFYAPATNNIVVPSAKIRGMTVAEADKLFPSGSPNMPTPDVESGRVFERTELPSHRVSGVSFDDEQQGAIVASRGRDYDTPRQSVIRRSTISRPSGAL